MTHPAETEFWPFAGLKLISAAAAGALLTFSYAPFDYHFIMLPLLAYVIWCGFGSSPQEGWKLGFAFGLGWFSAGLSWIYVSIDEFGGLPLIATLAILALLYIYLALFPALAFYLWRRLAQRRPQALFALPLFWLIAELLRGWLFTGFPWLRLGYSQTDSVLKHYAPVVGELGLSVLLILAATLLAAAVRWRRWVYLAGPLGVYLFGVVLTWFPATEPATEATKVALVQGNVKQSLKWDANQQWPNMLKYLDLSRPHYDQHDLIIWPESAITILEPFAADVLANLEQATRHNGTALVTGIIDYDRSSEAFYNSLISLGQQQPLTNTDTESLDQNYRYGHNNRYQKHQLLPIGEFVPFEDILRPLAPLFNLPMSSFSRGSYTQPNLQANGLKLAPAICYEIAFPQQVRKNVNADTDFLLTVSNDTWFGRSHGPWQHMQIAQMRALELGRPLLRATNSGVTAIVNAQGERTHTAPQFTDYVISADVYRETGTTWFHRFGNLGAWLIALFSALLASFSMVKARQKQ